MAKRLGYIRVSTHEQNIQRQLDKLQPYCDVLFIEKTSATSKKRPEFNRAKRKLRSGDTLVVLDLDRAFRSTLEALQIEQSLRKRNIKFEVLSMHIDNSTPEGELMLTILSGFAQYERKCLIRRTKQGLASARARGKHIGRPFKLSSDDAKKAKSMLENGMCLNEIARQFDCTKQTIKNTIERLSN